MKSMHRALGALLAFVVSALALDLPRTPTTVKFNQHQGAKRVYAKAIAGGENVRSFIRGVTRTLATLFAHPVVRAAAALAVLALTWDLAPDGVLAATGLAATADLKKARTELDEITKELWQIQEEHKGKPMPEDVGENFEAKAKRAEEIQDEIDRYMRIERLEGRTKDVPNPTLPEDQKDHVQDDVAAYMTLGDYVVNSEEFQALASKGWPKGAHAAIALTAMLHRGGRGVVLDRQGQPLVPLSREEAKAISERMEQKATPTIGSGIIEPARVPGIVQVTADDQLRLRDVLNVSPTNSDSIEYVREESFTRAAAETAEEAAKPEATIEYTLQTATVRDIAVHMPVTNQKLSDFPALANLINNRLLYDIRKREEEQIMYGDGVAPNLEGILVVSGTTDIAALARYTAGDPLTDKIRMGMTEVRTAGYQPNGLVIHPIDWETIVLLKGTDDHYLAQVFPTQDGQFRVWGLNVVETVAAEENAGNPTEERNLVVGDWMRGATLYDRMAAQIFVGLIDDQFIKNMRTILAEERVAFEVQAPAAFAFLETQALAT